MLKEVNQMHTLHIMCDKTTWSERDSFSDIQWTIKKFTNKTFFFYLNKSNSTLKTKPKPEVCCAHMRSDLLCLSVELCLSSLTCVHKFMSRNVSCRWRGRISSSLGFRLQLCLFFSISDDVSVQIVETSRRHRSGSQLGVKQLEWESGSTNLRLSSSAGTLTAK